jgi:RNA polymerase sigma-70 factor (ECF subfamily)
VISFDDLLDRFRCGDAAAADQLVAEHGPYLRVVVRRGLSRRLRTKFDSVDVVQSVWGHVLPALRDGVWSVPDRRHLRALLLTVARRRLVSHYRRHRTAVEREQPGGADLAALAEVAPGPSEIAQARETWERLLAICPPAHHELLRLRWQGFSITEIAARAGMHEGSVRRVIRRLARLMAVRQAPPAAEGSSGGAE